MRLYGLIAAALLCAGSLGAKRVCASEPVKLTLKDHRFTPDADSVPAGQRFRIELSNQDSTSDEFESYDMKFEKIVVPSGKIAVNAGPLHPGTYKFFDDYHPDTATGTVTAVEQKK